MENDQVDKKGRVADIATTDAWWCVLRSFEDYKTQVGLSMVCKEWDLVCKMIPKLQILVPPEKSKKGAESFLRRALRGRVGFLKELQLYYMPPMNRGAFPKQYLMTNNVPVNEGRLWRILQPFLTSLEVLELSLPYESKCKEFWPHCGKLESLEIHCFAIVDSPKNIQFRNLKHLEVHTFEGIPGFAVEEAIRACPVLEVLRLDINKESFLIESRSLLDLDLQFHAIRSYKIGEAPVELKPMEEEVEIKAWNLEVLRVSGCTHLFIHVAPKLKMMELWCVNLDVLSNLPELNRVVIGLLQHFPNLKNLLSVSPNLQHLTFIDNIGNI